MKWRSRRRQNRNFLYKEANQRWIFDLLTYFKLLDEKGIITEEGLLEEIKKTKNKKIC